MNYSISTQRTHNKIRNASAVMFLCAACAAANIYPAAQAKPTSPDCVLARNLVAQAHYHFFGYGGMSVTSRARKNFDAFRQLVIQSQPKAQDARLQAALDQVLESADELIDLTRQAQEDPDSTHTLPFTLAVNDANLEHTEASGALNDAAEAVCS